MTAKTNKLSDLGRTWFRNQRTSDLAKFTLGSKRVWEIFPKHGETILAQGRLDDVINFAVVTDGFLVDHQGYGGIITLYHPPIIVAVNEAANNARALLKAQRAELEAQMALLDAKLRTN